MIFQEHRSTSITVNDAHWLTKEKKNPADHQHNLLPLATEWHFPDPSAKSKQRGEVSHLTSPYCHIYHCPILSMWPYFINDVSAIPFPLFTWPGIPGQQMNGGCWCYWLLRMLWVLTPSASLTNIDRKLSCIVVEEDNTTTYDVRLLSNKQKVCHLEEHPNGQTWSIYHCISWKTLFKPSYLSVYCSEQMVYYCHMLLFFWKKLY